MIANCLLHRQQNLWPVSKCRLSKQKGGKSKCPSGLPWPPNWVVCKQATLLCNSHITYSVVMQCSKTHGLAKYGIFSCSFSLLLSLSLSIPPLPSHTPVLLNPQPYVTSHRWQKQRGTLPPPPPYRATEAMQIHMLSILWPPLLFDSSWYLE